MSSQVSILHNHFDANLTGPHISDEDVKSFIESGLIYADYLDAIGLNTHQIPLARQMVNDTGIKIAAMVGYPVGDLPLDVKLIQYENALRHGVSQINVALATPHLVSEHYDQLRQEVKAITTLNKTADLDLVMVANLSYLTEEQKIVAAKEVSENGAILMDNAEFLGVKTPIETIHLLKKEVGENLKLVLCGENLQAIEAVNLVRSGILKISMQCPFSLIEGCARILQLKEGVKAE